MHHLKPRIRDSVFECYEDQFETRLPAAASFHQLREILLNRGKENPDRGVTHVEILPSADADDGLGGDQWRRGRMVISVDGKTG